MWYVGRKALAIMAAPAADPKTPQEHTTNTQQPTICTYSIPSLPHIPLPSHLLGNPLYRGIHHTHRQGGVVASTLASHALGPGFDFELHDYFKFCCVFATPFKSI
eukprot:sb/3477917/